jgi:hypothetical protein
MTSPIQYYGTPLWLKNSLLQIHSYRQSITTYDQLYNGDVEESIPNRFIAQRMSSRDYYHINISRTAVDSPLELTKVNGITCADDKARTLLENWWTDQELDFESHSTHERAYQYGNSALIVLPDPETGELAAYAHSPRDVMVFYSANNPRKKSHAVHLYTVFGTPGDIDAVTPDSPGADHNYGDPSYASYINTYAASLNTMPSHDSTNPYTQDQEYLVAEVYFEDVILKYVSVSPIPLGMVNLTAVNMRLADEIPEPIPGIIPCFHFRTARTPFGRSRLADLSGLQSGMDITYSAMMAAIRAASWKQRYLTSERGEGIGDNFERNTPINDDVDTDEFQAGMDTIFTFNGHNVKVGEFSVSTSDNFIQAIDKITALFSKVSDVPEHHYSGRTPPSGESIRQADRPLIAVVEHCQALFAATWKEVFQYVLAYYGTTADAEVSWAQTMHDTLDYLNSQLLKRELGVPDSVLLQEAGYSSEVVEKWEADAALEAANTPTLPPATDPTMPQAVDPALTPEEAAANGPTY